MRRFPSRRAAMLATLLTATLLVGTGGVASADPPFVESEARSIHVLTGDADGDYFGWVAANIGDITGDGVEDLLVPAIADGSFAGKATVYSGATGVELAEHVGGPGELFGYSAAAAGDVDGDGTGDYVVAAPGASTNPAPFGRVVVFSGADHEELLEIEAVDTAFFGSGVSGAGDADGDGHADILVGASLASGAGPASGWAGVYSGDGGSLLWEMDGRHPGDLAGAGVGLVGDVDEDGTDDVVVAASGNGGEAYLLSGGDGDLIHRFRGRSGAGQAYGTFFASGAGDIDADGTPDVFVGDYLAGRGATVGTGAAYVYSGRTGRPLHVLRGEEVGGGYGPGRGVGDVNGDGHDDLIIAAYTSSIGAPTAGRAYVVSGADGSTLRTITSTVVGDNFGVDALALGDVDGDGLTDFVVTSVGLSFFGLAPGTTYVIAGTPLD